MEWVWSHGLGSKAVLERGWIWVLGFDLGLDFDMVELYGCGRNGLYGDFNWRKDFENGFGTQQWVVGWWELGKV